VIECCANAYTTTEPIPTLGSSLPERVMHVRWFGRAFGSEILVGVAAGPVDWVNQMWLVRGYHCQWTSRFLQNALAYLLTDDEARLQVDRGRQEYDRRRSALVAELAQRGVASSSTHGTSVWIPVPHEDHVRVHLAREGFAVQGGADFFVRPDAPPHVRISVAGLSDDIERVAELVAAACSPVQSGGPTRSR
jgi:DNA-binding transcriptional MocR family regulator